MTRCPTPTLIPMCTIECAVLPLVSLGDAPSGERRFVPLGSGRVHGPELEGELIAGGVDWQWRRADGALEISAHYAVRCGDGSVVEIRSEGLRHGDADVMEALARGEPVAAERYFFRTFVRFATGAPAWAHLNRSMAVASGARAASGVVLDFYRVA
jgi:hypothetical protein